MISTQAFKEAVDYWAHLRMTRRERETERNGEREGRKEVRR